MRRAQSTYNDRDSNEGLEAHRLEEAERRARHSARSVGDHRCHEKTGELRVRPSTAPHAVVETIDASPASPVPPPPVEALELQACTPAKELREVPEPQLAWVLVAWSGLLETASRRQGTEASCPFCGRQGRIVEVISVEQWQHRRRGFGQEA